MKERKRAKKVGNQPVPTDKSTRPTQTPSAKPAPTPAPVWRAVEPKSVQTQVAPPIAETARVESEKGATFRKPIIR